MAADMGIDLPLAVSSGHGGGDDGRCHVGGTEHDCNSGNDVPQSASRPPCRTRRLSAAAVRAPWTP